MSSRTLQEGEVLRKTVGSTNRNREREPGGIVNVRRMGLREREREGEVSNRELRWERGHCEREREGIELGG